MNVLLDTCVILDFLENRENFAADAEKIILLCASGKLTGFVTSKSIPDLFYVYRKAIKDPSEACRRIKELLSIVYLLSTDKDDVLNALELPYTNDFEDDLMIETAKRERIDLIITRNTKDYSKSPIKTVSPTAFLAQNI